MLGRLGRWSFRMVRWKKYGQFLAANETNKMKGCINREPIRGSKTRSIKGYTDSGIVIAYNRDVSLAYPGSAS